MNKHDVITDLMNQFGTDVLHLTYSYVRNRQTSEDLTQEIFIKCFEKLDTFEQKSSMQTWLYRIAVNHCKDYLKSWHYRKIHVTDYVSSLFSSKHTAAEEDYMNQVEKSELLEAVFQLPIKYREIIFLYYYQECSQKDMSEICNVNINTIKSRMAKGREILKRNLMERGVYYGEGIKKS